MVVHTGQAFLTAKDLSQQPWQWTCQHLTETQGSLYASMQIMHRHEDCGTSVGWDWARLASLWTTDSSCWMRLVNRSIMALRLPSYPISFHWIESSSVSVWVNCELLSEEEGAEIDVEAPSANDPAAADEVVFSENDASALEYFFLFREVKCLLLLFLFLPAGMVKLFSIWGGGGKLSSLSSPTFTSSFSSWSLSSWSRFIIPRLRLSGTGSMTEDPSPASSKRTSRIAVLDPDTCWEVSGERDD